MRLDQVSDQWWKDAVVYCIDVRAFLDSDGDGVGDLDGVIRRMDHLAELGVTCLWLMPFQPSPCRDGGYDISDYYGVDPRLGTLGDFVELVRAANDRGVRVICDLVVNHTSDQHPWFQESRSSDDSPRRGWYVWRDEPSDEPKGLAFPGKENSNWTRDADAGQYYLHRFYHFEPDLDTANAEVREEIARIVGFWLALGVAGFRMDAVPAMLETAGLPERVANDPRDWLRDLRAFVSRRRGDAMLLGEVNVDPQQLAQYFGDHGDLLQLEFAFLLNQALWLSLARGEADALETMVRMLPQVPPDSGWATFLRNHDELTLDKLSVAQRREVFGAFGPDEHMQLYGHGIRRRAAPMLDGDPDRLRLAWSLTFSLPGTPVLLYGDEIGLGENLTIEDRYCGSRTDAVVGRAARRLHDRGGAVSAAGRGQVRSRTGQRRRPATRPRLAVAVDAPAHLVPARAAGARVGERDAGRHRTAVDLRAPLRLGGRHGGRRSQSGRGARVGDAGAGRGRRRRRGRTGDVRA